MNGMHPAASTLVTSAFSAKKNHRNQVVVMLKTKPAQKDHPHAVVADARACLGVAN